MFSKKFGQHRSGHQHGTVTLIPGSGKVVEVIEAAALALAGPFADARIALETLPGLPPHSTKAALLTQFEERQLVREAKELAPSDEIRIVFTEQGLYNHWFSHWHSAQRTAIVSLHNWSCFSSLRVTSFVAYESLLHGLRAVNDRYSPTRFWHEDSRACVFDFCAHKHGIDRKLQAGEMCRICTAALEEIGIRAGTLAPSLSTIRGLALARCA